MLWDKTSLTRIIGQRALYIWGAMIVGQGLCRAMTRHGLTIHGFIDSSPAMQGQLTLGYSVQAPEPILQAASQGHAFILIGSGHHDYAIRERCQAAGLQDGQDFLMSRDINDIDPSIDVSGFCNLHCLSCPQGNQTDKPLAGFMPVDHYQQILDKLLVEIPFLGSIQLYAWGEPLLHPALPEIITLTRNAGVLVAISTNLKRGGTVLEDVIAAQPDWIKISASGFGQQYEIAHTGGRWPQFLTNLHHLARLRDQYHPALQIILNYHLYKHSIGDPYYAMQSLCEELGFIFRPNMAYLYSLDTVVDYIEGRPLSIPAQQTLTMLLMTIDDGLQRALARKQLPCPEERCLPINWDGRVRFCGVYFKPFIAENFLTTPLTTLLQQRRNSDFCARCMEYGLHQYTGVYLEERFLTTDSTQ
jgi:hypothetical protein